MSVSILATLALLTGAEPGQTMSPEEAQAKVRQTLNATGPAIDQCVAKYLAENPEQAAKKGSAGVTVSVSENGAVGRSSIDVALPGARNLRVCLEKVARQWKFPPPSKPDQSFTLKIPVRKGLKFRIPAPGEKPPEPPPGEEPEGYINFMPNFSVTFAGAKEE